jgi:hypothetical protein
MTDFSMNIVDDAEKLFPPKPGGMVEQARAQQSQTVPDSVVESRYGYNAIRVDVCSAEVFSAQTYVISTTLNPVWRVLGYDENRKRAVIQTLDEPIVVAVSQATANDNRNVDSGSAANAAGGFVLALNGDNPSTPLVIKGTGEVWVAATSDTATRVSVWAESYADTSA